MNVVSAISSELQGTLEDGVEINRRTSLAVRKEHNSSIIKIINRRMVMAVTAKNRLAGSRVKIFQAQLCSKER